MAVNSTWSTRNCQEQRKVDHGKRPKIYHGSHLPAVLQRCRRTDSGKY